MNNVFLTDDGKRLRKFIFKEIHGERIAVETDEWAAYQEKLQRTRLADKAHLPKSIQTLTWDDYVGPDRAENIAKLQRFAHEFDETFRNSHLYIWSKKNATQKTTAASLLGLELLRKNKTVQFVLMNDLVKTLTKEPFDETGRSTEKVNAWKTCDFLIIDDAFDKAKVTVYKSNYQLSFLDDFLRHRLEIDSLATCFTSNIPVEEIHTVFDRHLQSLVERCAATLEFNDSLDLKNDFNPNSIWD